MRWGWASAGMTFGTTAAAALGAPQGVWIGMLAIAAGCLVVAVHAPVRAAWESRRPTTPVGQSLSQSWAMRLYTGEPCTLVPAKQGGDPWVFSFDCAGGGVERKFNLLEARRFTAIRHPLSGNLVRKNELPATLRLDDRDDAPYLELVRFDDVWLVVKDYGNPGSAVVLELDVPRGDGG